MPPYNAVFTTREVATRALVKKKSRGNIFSIDEGYVWFSIQGAQTQFRNQLILVTCLVSCKIMVAMKILLGSLFFRNNTCVAFANLSLTKI